MSLDSIADLENPTTRQEDNSEVINKIGRVREMNLNDWDLLSSVVGPKFKERLNELHVPFFIFKNRVNIRAKSTNAGTKNWPERLGAPGNYLRNEFATVISDKLILLSVWKRIADDSSLPEKVAQMDFMNLDDWRNSNVSTKMAYSKGTQGEKMGGEGLSTPGTSFLRKMSLLVRAIDSTCLIQVASSESRRKKIYKAGLADLKNVVFIDTKD